jgi:hypothetical protein
MTIEIFEELSKKSKLEQKSLLPKKASMFLEVLKDMRMYRNSDAYRETRARYEESY